jgi:hypothetical protein
MACSAVGSVAVELATPEQHASDFTRNWTPAPDVCLNPKRDQETIAGALARTDADRKWRQLLLSDGDRG